MKNKINIDEFLVISEQLEITFGQITEAVRIPKSHGIKLIVDFGEGDVRSVFTNLGKTHEPDLLINLICPFVTNLTPVEIKGVMSEAMIMVGVGPNDEPEITLDFIGIGTKLL